MPLQSSENFNQGHSFVIPAEAQVGWNWAKQDANNPDGLIKWKGLEVTAASARSADFNLGLQPMKSSPPPPDRLVSIDSGLLLLSGWRDGAEGLGSDNAVRSYPNLYVLLIGGPGIGKSQALSHAERFWRP